MINVSPQQCSSEHRPKNGGLRRAFVSNDLFRSGPTEPRKWEQSTPDARPRGVLGRALAASGQIDKFCAGSVGISQYAVAASLKIIETYNLQNYEAAAYPSHHSPARGARSPKRSGTEGASFAADAWTSK